MSNATFNMNNPNQLNAPAKKSKLPLILGIVFGLLLLCCGVGGIGVYVAYSYGIKEMAKMSVNESPEAKEAIGEVESASIDMTATSQNPGKLIVDVQGSNGSGKLTLKQDPGQPPIPLELKMSDGKVISYESSEPDAPKIELPKFNAPEPASP